MTQQNRGNNNKKLVTLLSDLLTGAKSSPRPFVLSQVSRGQVLALAKKMYHHLQYMPSQEPICLVSRNRSTVAAALLAAAAGGPPMVLPHAFSKEALEAARCASGSTCAIVDSHQLLPSSFKPLHFSPQGITGKLPPLPALDPDRIILKIFTGGSSGTPRLWTKTVANLFGEALFLARRLGIDANDRIVATVPSYHIYGLLFSVLIPFIASASVVPGYASFPKEIRTALEKSGATILVSVPLHYRVLRGGKIPAEKMRLAISSAGPLDPEDGDYFFRQTGVGITEIYGSTETGGIASRCRARGETFLTPFAPVEWKITANRLCIRSPFLSPDLKCNNELFYRTADRVRADGKRHFELIGRMDGIIKIGGKRVDLMEVREKLKKIPGVKDAVAISLSAKKGRDHEIIAVIEGNISIRQLQKAMPQILEPVATPRRIRLSKHLPITPAGKYDRKKICALFD